MSTYKCVVSDLKGRKIEILRDAPSEDLLIASFLSGDLFLIKYAEADKKEKLKKRFSTKVLIDFTDIMASLLDAKLSVQDSLQMIMSIEDNVSVRKLASELYAGLLHGEHLYNVMALFPSTFSSLYRGMVRLSEKTGQTALIFRQLSNYLHNSRNMKNKIIESLSYPILVLIFAFLCCIGLVFFLSPKISNVLIQFNNKNTMEIINKIDTIYFFLIMCITFLFVCIIFVMIVILLYRKKTNFAEFIDRIVLKLPFIGKYLISSQIMDFSFSMELLVNAGRNISEALQESVLSLSNLYLKKSIHIIYNEISKGKLLSVAFSSVKVFPSYITVWIKVGEKSGDVGQVFSQIRKYFQYETERVLKRISIWLEPVFIIIAGLSILFLVVNFVVPIFTMYGNVL